LICSESENFLLHHERAGATVLLAVHQLEEPTKRHDFRLTANQELTEAERIFHELARSGRVVMPLEKTFLGGAFGWL